MMLIEQTAVPASALPVGQFKDHLRLGTGFADAGTQDTLIEVILRAAMAAVENRTGKVLLTRSYTWTMTAWRNAVSQALPVAPIEAITDFRTFDRADVETAIGTSAYVLEKDTHRPHLQAAAGCLPQIPFGGRAEIVFDAGFGPAWADVPAELGHAVFLLAAHYYEYRSSSAPDEAAMPRAVLALLEPWRTVRILGGGAA